ncbi:MAG: hypothetical protein H0U53_00240 [Actinobacteria bacterium]|nr:hypothetical protein [Actinomycetota bacterium]
MEQSVRRTPRGSLGLLLRVSTGAAAAGLIGALIGGLLAVLAPDDSYQHCQAMYYDGMTCFLEGTVQPGTVGLFRGFLVGVVVGLILVLFIARWRSRRAE